MRLCIDVLGVIAVVSGACLFSGTKRETLWDRDNLVGLLLIGIALSAHGGLDTFLRSSPLGVFSGYDLGWSHSGDSGWIWLYDLGYPPEGDFWAAPSRHVYIPAGRRAPDAVWRTDKVWLLRVTYRTRDLQVVRVEGKPVPSAEASGLRAWGWQSKEPLLRPALEMSVGLALMVGTAIGLAVRRVSPDASSLHLNLVGDVQR